MEEPKPQSERVGTDIVSTYKAAMEFKGPLTVAQISSAVSRDESTVIYAMENVLIPRKHVEKRSSLNFNRVCVAYEWVSRSRKKK